MNNQTYNEVIKLHFDVKGDDFSLAGEASSAVKTTLKQIGINANDVRRTSIAMYEAEMNLVIHAGGGKIDIEISQHSIKAIFDDNGPGIDNVDMAMTEGFSTAPDSVRELGFGAGMGLPNIKRNTDKLNITSELGKGTRLEMEVVF